MLAPCHAPGASHDGDAGAETCVSRGVTGADLTPSRESCGCKVQCADKSFIFHQAAERSDDDDPHRVIDDRERQSLVTKTNIAAQCCYYFSDKKLIVNVPPHKEWEQKVAITSCIVAKCAVTSCLWSQALKCFSEHSLCKYSDLSLYLFLI